MCSGVCFFVSHINSVFHPTINSVTTRFRSRHMSNEKLKSLLGWFIIGSQLILLVTAFVLHANDPKQFGETERAAVFGSVLPPLAIYGAAAITFMLNDPDPRRKRWREQIAPRNRVAVTLLLPPIPFLMTLFLIIMSLYGKVTQAGVSNSVVLIQTVQSGFVALIYGWFFKDEVRALSARANEEDNANEGRRNP